MTCALDEPYLLGIQTRFASCIDRSDNSAVVLEKCDHVQEFQMCTQACSKFVAIVHNHGKSQTK